MSAKLITTKKKLTANPTGRFQISSGPSAAGKGAPTIKAFILSAYKVLYRIYGPQKWWPAKSRFEVIVGAILTQNTNWLNVEKAIMNLRRAKLLSAAAMQDVPVDILAGHIRPSGYYNQKAIKLKRFLDYFFSTYNGQIRSMCKTPLRQLRQELLDVHGIGPETADSILLYALDKPIFVIDAYTKRILLAHGIINEGYGYHDTQRLFHEALEEDVALYNEYHALIVRVAKDYYQPKKTLKESPLYQI